MSVLEKVVSDLKERLAMFETLERELREYFADCYDEDFWEISGGWDHLLEELRIRDEREESYRRRILKLERTLKAYQEMFPCSVCGKPMEWQSDDNLGQALKAFVKEKHWGHGACVNPQKK